MLETRNKNFYIVREQTASEMLVTAFGRLKYLYGSRCSQMFPTLPCTLILQSVA
jgi:hypothetical protein